MGVIYLARQEALDREVILKVVRSDRTDDEAEARFRREARRLSLLSHANVVQIFDHGFDEATGLWFIVMAFIAISSRATSCSRLPTAPSSG